MLQMVISAWYKI